MFDNKKLVDLYCDICGKQMSMTKDETDVVRFLCPDKMQQRWTFERDSVGEIWTSCTILKHLYPSSIKEDNEMYRDSFLPNWLEKSKFYAQACYLAGFFDIAERNAHQKSAEETLINKYIELDAKKKPWWKFW